MERSRIAIVWAQVFITISCSTPDYALSTHRLSWKATLDECSRTGNTLVYQADVVRWTSPAGGPPSVLPVNTLVWMAARVLQSLWWNNASGGSLPFFRMSPSCHYLEESLKAPNYSHSYGPLSCLEECASNSKFIYLHGDVCFCTERQRLPRDETLVCNVACADGHHFCGRSSRYFSEYEIPDGIVLDVSSFHYLCFYGDFTDDGRLVIRGSSCNTSRQGLCLDDTFQAGMVAWGSFHTTSAACKALNLLLPSKTTDNMSDTDFVRKLKDIVDSRKDLRNQSIWLNLSAKKRAVWITGQDFELQLTDSNPGCIAMVTTGSNISFTTLPCQTPLSFLCEYGDMEGGARPTLERDAALRQKIEVAMAVGISGIVCFVVFIVIASTLYVMKRSGKLTVGQKPAFPSIATLDPDDDDSNGGTRSAALRLHNEKWRLGDPRASPVRKGVLDDDSTGLVDARPGGMEEQEEEGGVDPASGHRQSPAARRQLADFNVSVNPGPLRHNYGDVDGLAVMSATRNASAKEVADSKLDAQKQAGNDEVLDELAAFGSSTDVYRTSLAASTM